jgi:succinate dehydrogenase/fumarate reductase flavoprotein subunit
MDVSLQSVADQDVFDVVVIGAGCAGMSAALCAAIDGARVLLVERTEYLGGTTALSAATSWVPLSKPGLAVDPSDSYEKALDFLDRAVGARAPRALREAFLANGHEAVAKLEDNSHVQYQVRQLHPDYMTELPGSVLRGRAIEPKPFDGRLLGKALKLIRPPIPEFTVLGGMMVDRDDIGHLLNVGKSFKSFRYAMRIILRHQMDRLLHGRGTRLVMGNALIGRLLLSLHERKVTVVTRCNVTALQTQPATEKGAIVTGVVIEQDGVRRQVAVRGGVILASGGFNRHPKRRGEWLPDVSSDWCPAAPGHTGSAQDLAIAIGASYGATELASDPAEDGKVLSHAFWAPVSIRKRADGSVAAFPHFVMDRGKPGMITVNQRGERFVNESTSYHLFGLAMQAADRYAPSIPAWLVCDAEALARYGLGMIRPGAKEGASIAPFLADGYLTQGRTVAELAAKMGADPAVLTATIERFNAAAERGADAEFQRGSTDYQRANGDATRSAKNPCLGALRTGPYYAIRLYPGDIGAATGLRTDAAARVLDQRGEPIAGLYACGNDMHSIMGGTYPAPGITIGPGLTFAYLAAQDAVARSAT